MRRVRVCVFGGTDLEARSSRLVAAIVHEILRRMHAVVVTGGLRHPGNAPGAISTDAAALTGARRYCDEYGVDPADHYEAWVPEPGLDRRPELGGVVRMSEADGVTVHRVPGRTPLGRRLGMIRGVDVLVTISGRTETEVVGEPALELGIPLLPIPTAGGDSAQLLDDYHDRIAARSHPEPWTDVSTPSRRHRTRRPPRVPSSTSSGRPGSGGVSSCSPSTTSTTPCTGASSNPPWPGT